MQGSLYIERSGRFRRGLAEEPVLFGSVFWMKTLRGQLISSLVTYHNRLSFRLIRVGCVGEKMRTRKLF